MFERENVTGVTVVCDEAGFLLDNRFWLGLTFCSFSKARPERTQHVEIREGRRSLLLKAFAFVMLHLWSCGTLRKGRASA